MIINLNDAYFKWVILDNIPLLLGNQLHVQFFFKDFIYLFDRQRLQAGREAGRERERWKQAPC